jgi:thioredoxin reductase (NADPH)
LGIADEDRLSGYGVSWCATCDGAFYKQKTVAVVGGGDSAMEEATFLTRFADKVYIIHRSDALRASAVMQERAKNDPKIEFVFNATVAHIYGDDTVSGVGLLDTVTGSENTLDVSGLFIAIGSDPRTHVVHGQLDLTDQGTIAVQGRTSLTNLEGVFAAGDVIDPSYRQAITAAGSGCVAALDAQHYLESLPHDAMAHAAATN